MDKAIAFANELFLILEARDHRVVIAPNPERFHRADVHERENPGNGHHHDNLWSPMRCTVVYIGTVAIGLTAIEMSEAAEARYVNGEYVRLTDFVPKRRGWYAQDYGWTSNPGLPDRAPMPPGLLAVPAGQLDPGLERDTVPGPFRQDPGYRSRAGEGHGRNSAARRGGGAPGGDRTKTPGS